MKDILERIKKEQGPLGQYAERAEGYYIFPELEGPLGNRMTFNGQEVIVWSINNYLGLGNLDSIRQVDADIMKDYGAAYPMGSRMMSGQTSFHNKLEAELAEFVDKESAVLLNYGYQGIMSAIECIVNRRDVIVYDADCHACIIDGVRLHFGKRLVYQHNDMESLEKQLAVAVKIADEQNGGVLVISEGVFGMRGDQGKLKEIVDLKSKYSFRLMVDDAHGFGTLGKTGAGAGEEQGVQDEIDVYFATFAKSFASIGAFIAGDPSVVQYLKYNMRSQIFAKSLPMVFVRGALARLALIKNDTSFNDRLWKNVRSLQSGLKAAGFDLGETNSCVTPVYMYGDVDEAMAIVRDLRENYKIFCSIVVYPVIPKGMILLRLIPTADHTQEDIDQTIEAFVAVSEKLKNSVYKKAIEEVNAK